MKKVEMIKLAGKIIITVGTSNIVSNIVRCTTPIMIGPINRACIGVGCFVLGAMLGDKAVNYAEETFNDAKEQIKNMVENGELN